MFLVVLLFEAHEIHLGRHGVLTIVLIGVVHVEQNSTRSRASQVLVGGGVKAAEGRFDTLNVVLDLKLTLHVALYVGDESIWSVHHLLVDVFLLLLALELLSGNAGAVAGFEVANEERGANEDVVASFAGDALIGRVSLSLLSVLT